MNMRDETFYKLSKEYKVTKDEELYISQYLEDHLQEGESKSLNITLEKVNGEYLLTVGGYTGPITDRSAVMVHKWMWEFDPMYHRNNTFIKF